MPNYETLKAKLLLQEKELSERVSKIKLDLQQKNRLSQDFAEQATETENDEVLNGLLTEGERELAEIHQALSLMAAGIYGVCQECGQEIAYERLEAIPQTQLCIDCANI